MNSDFFSHYNHPHISHGMTILIHPFARKTIWIYVHSTLAQHHIHRLAKIMYKQKDRNSAKRLAVPDFLCNFAAEEINTYAYGSEQQIHTF